MTRACFDSSSEVHRLALSAASPRRRRSGTKSARSMRSWPSGRSIRASICRSRCSLKPGPLTARRRAICSTLAATPDSRHQSSTRVVADCTISTIAATDRCRQAEPSATAQRCLRSSDWGQQNHNRPTPPVPGRFGLACRKALDACFPPHRGRQPRRRPSDLHARRARSRRLPRHSPTMYGLRRRP